MSLRRLLCIVVGVCTAVASGDGARADLVSVDGLGTINLNAGTQSAPMTIGLRDLNAASPVTLLGWSLGLRIVPLGGATGTVTFDQPSFANATNNIFQGGVHAPGPLGVGDNNPAAGDFTVTNTDNAFTGVQVPGTSRGLVDFRLNASSLASGTFEIRLVDADPSSAASLHNSNWFDDSFVQHYLTVDGAAFTNGMVLGTIEVQAIPEPSSLLLASLGLIPVGRRFWKRRQATSL